MTEDTDATTATMPIEDYLAQGGQLTSPANVPARYRGELLRLMASFVDSELAASAGLADTIHDAPGITARIAACRATPRSARPATAPTCASRCSTIRSRVGSTPS